MWPVTFADPRCLAGQRNGLRRWVLSGDLITCRTECVSRNLSLLRLHDVATHNPRDGVNS